MSKPYALLTFFPNSWFNGSRGIDWDKCFVLLGQDLHRRCYLRSVRDIHDGIHHCCVSEVKNTAVVCLCLHSNINRKLSLIKILYLIYSY